MDFEAEYGTGNVGKCPHCGKDSRYFPAFDEEGSDWLDKEIKQSGNSKSFVRIGASVCSLCLEVIVWANAFASGEEMGGIRVWPIGSERPVPEKLPLPIASVYKRASRLFDFDNIACAAFARTCMEKLLDDQKVPKGRNLEAQIANFLESRNLPSELRQNVDKLREMGNFIHLNESFTTGDMLEISPEEAKWALDILADLFEELYVRPSEQQGRRRAFEAKQNETRRDKAGN